MEQKKLCFSEQWDFFPCHVDSTPYSIRFDSGVMKLEESEKEKYPHTIELIFSYLESHENGFPTQSEAARINAVEDDFSCGGFNVRQIGAITGGGRSRFAFCCSGTDEDIEKIISALLGKNSVLEYEKNIFKNDNFNYFYSMLMPNVYENNWIMNRKLCFQLEQHGETFTEPREIDFYCDFDSIEHIQAVADKLNEQGFKEVSRNQTEDGGYSLYLILEGVPEFNWINEITAGIIDLLDGTDGYFDGWGCPTAGAKPE
jgi:hypothetical protein